MQWFSALLSKVCRRRKRLPEWIYLLILFYRILINNQTPIYLTDNLKNSPKERQGSLGLHFAHAVACAQSSPQIGSVITT